MIEVEKFTLNHQSLNSLCEKTQQIFLYGWLHCKYLDVGSELYFNSKHIKKVFFGFQGDLDTKEHKKDTTIEDRKIEQIKYDKISGKIQRTICKSTLVNIVLENCKRNIENQALIPLIFCIDIDNNPYFYDPLSIARRDKSKAFVTFSELRRLYKLCCEFEKESLDRQMISTIAKESVIFVKLIKNTQNEYELKKIPPFWTDANWANEWTKRQEAKSQFPPTSSKVNQWRKEIIKRLEFFLKNSDEVKNT